MKIPRPDFITDSMLAELDRMHGDGSKEPDIMRAVNILDYKFGLDDSERRQAVTYWLATMIKKEKEKPDEN